MAIPYTQNYPLICSGCGRTYFGRLNSKYCSRDCLYNGRLKLRREKRAAERNRSTGALSEMLRVQPKEKECVFVHTGANSGFWRLK